MARSVGVPFDIRKNCPYEIYNLMNFKSLLTRHGDSFDRYSLRVAEMKCSNRIIYYCLSNMPSGRFNTFERRAVDENNYMEMIINHFKYYFESIKPLSNLVYVPTEAPKGEFGVTFVSDGSNKPYRCKFRAPGYFHLQGLPYMTHNRLLADLVTIIGTQDLVFGEIDK